MKRVTRIEEMNKSESSTTYCLFLDVVDITHDGFTLAIEISTLAVNSLFSITAVIANAFIAHVIYRTPSLQTPSSVLLCCLALSDFVTGLMTQPSFVAYKISELTGNATSACIGRVIHWVAGFTCTGVSVMTIASIAIDKFLALHLHLRYEQIVTNFQLAKVILFIWLCCAFIGIYVIFIHSDKYWTFIPLPMLLVSLFVTAVCYFQIFRIVRCHQRQIRATERRVSQQKTSTIDLKNYKKSALTMAYVVILFICSNVPFLIAMVVRVVMGYNSNVKLAYEIGGTVMYINSTLNPVLYLVRMKDVRRAAFTLIRRLYSDPDRVIQFSSTTSIQIQVRFERNRETRCTTD